MMIGANEIHWLIINKYYCIYADYFVFTTIYGQNNKKAKMNIIYTVLYDKDVRVPQRFY